MCVVEVENPEYIDENIRRDVYKEVFFGFRSAELVDENLVLHVGELLVLDGFPRPALDVRVEGAEMDFLALQIDKPYQTELRRFLQQFSEGVHPPEDVLLALVEEKRGAHRIILENGLVFQKVDFMKTLDKPGRAGERGVDIFP